MNHPIVAELKSQSTWRLFGISLITFFVYAAHYVSWQTRIINAHCDEERKIPNGLVTSVFAFAYLSLALFVPYLFVEEGHPIESISNLVDTISSVLFIVWGFKARNRMNEILSSQREETGWFHGLWTFFFTPLYFNFKVNQLNEAVEPVDAVSE